MENYYKKSKKMLIEKIKENKRLKKADWDSYAHENYLFSANTLMFHCDANNFEELKKKLS